MAITKAQILNAAQRFLDKMVPRDKQRFLDTVIEIIDPEDAKPLTFRNLNIVRKRSIYRPASNPVFQGTQEKKAA